MRASYSRAAPCRNDREAAAWSRRPSGDRFAAASSPTRQSTVSLTTPVRLAVVAGRSGCASARYAFVAAMGFAGRGAEAARALLGWPFQAVPFQCSMGVG